MTTVTYRQVIAGSIGLVALLIVPAIGGDYEQGTGYTAVKVGAIGAGEVKLNGETADHSAGLDFGVQLDFPFGERWHYGLAIELLQMNWTAQTDGFSIDESELLIDIGITTKMMFRATDSPLAFRPGIGAGFGTLRRMAGFNGSNYLTLRAFAELVYFPVSGPGWLAEIGIWHAPSGGDSETDISIGPLLTLRAGVLF